MTTQPAYLFRFECCGFGAYGPREDISGAIHSLKHAHKAHLNYKKCGKKPTVMIVMHIKKEIEIGIDTLDPDYQETISDYLKTILPGNPE